VDVEKPVLVVGGDGLVGYALNEYLSRAGCRVITTTRRKAEVRPHRTLLLDLEQDPKNFELPDKIPLAVIAAGCSGFETCRANEELSHRINVTNTVKLAEELRDRGAFIVFLSSSAVFDGSAAKANEATPCSPTSLYGSQKAEAESAISALTNNYAIVRFGKAIPHAYPRFMTWHQQLSKGLKIRVLNDLRFAPLTTDYLVECLRLILHQEAKGIFHLSPADDISYADVAEYICKKFGFPKGLVVAESVQESGLKIEYVPRHAALGAAASLTRLSLAAPLAWDAVDHGLPGTRLDVHGPVEIISQGEV